MVTVQVMFDSGLCDLSEEFAKMDASSWYFQINIAAERPRTQGTRQGHDSE